MSDIKILSKNAIFNFLAYAVNVIVVFISIPLFAIYLGAINYGLYFLFIGLIGYYSIFDFGFSQAVTKFVSEYCSDESNKEINSIITSSFVVNFTIGFIVFCVVFLFNDSILNLLNVPPKSFQIAKTSLIITSIAFFLSAIYSVFISVFQGLLRYDITSKLNIFFSIFSNTISIILLVLGFSLSEVMLNYLLFVLICIFISYYLLKKILPNFTFTRNNLISTSKRLFNFSFFVFANKLSNLINTNFLQFLLSSFYSPAVVPYFMVPMKLVNLIQGAIANLSNVIFPYSSSLSAKNMSDSIKNLFIKSTKIIFSFSFPLYIFMCFYAFEILTLWMGADFATKSQIVLIFLTLAYFLSSITIAPTNILYGMGHSKFVGILSLILLPINLTLQIILIKFFSYNGAAIATFVAAFAGPIYFFYVAKKFILLSFIDMKKIISRPIFVGMIIIILFSVLKVLLVELEIINSIYTTLFLGLISPSFYFFIFIKDNKEFNVGIF